MPIEYNTITATADANWGSSLWTGVYIVSQQNSVTGTFLDNSISGAGSSYATTAGYTVLSTAATTSVTLSGDSSPLNSVSNVTYGVWETTGDPNGIGGAAASNMNVTVSGLNISAGQYGVYVEEDPSYTSYTVAATIDGGTSITTGGGGTGVFVSGAKASATISGNTGSIYGNAIGIDAEGGSATISGNHIYGNTTGVKVGSGTASISGNNFAGSHRQHHRPADWRRHGHVTHLRRQYLRRHHDTSTTKPARPSTPATADHLRGSVTPKPRSLRRNRRPLRGREPDHRLPR